MPRSWIFPCGGGVYQCSTQDIYYSFTYGPQPGCPTLQNFTATPPPETTCSLANNSCSFVAGAPTCVSWLQDCNYEYSCVTEEEFSAATSGGEVVCSFPSAPPPSPDSVCIPVDTTCKWYDPCHTWQGWCGGEYMCGTESEYAAFIHGPQPLCVTPSPNATEPVPEAECVYQNGRCVWSGMYVQPQHHNHVDLVYIVQYFLDTILLFAKYNVFDTCLCKTTTGFHSWLQSVYRGSAPVRRAGSVDRTTSTE